VPVPEPAPVPVPEPAPVPVPEPAPVPATAPELVPVDFAALRTHLVSITTDKDSGLVAPFPPQVQVAPRPVIRFDAQANAFRSTEHQQNAWISNWLGNNRDSAAENRLNNWKIRLTAVRSGART